MIFIGNEGRIEMKPLSVSKYIKNNKKSYITSIIAIALSIILGYGVECFIESISESSYSSQVKPLEKAFTISRISDKEISLEYVDKLKKSDFVEKLIPTNISYVKYSTQGSVSNVRIFSILPEDREYFMNKYDMTLEKGSLPKEGQKEIAIDERIAKNNNVSIGDSLGDNKIVGVLSSEYFLSLSSYASTSDEVSRYKDISKDDLIKNEMVIFPNDDKRDDLDELIRTFSKKDINYSILSEGMEKYQSGTSSSKQILDALFVLIVIVMVVTLSSSKYAQFINRKIEFGILNALGYSRGMLMKRALKEVLIFNLSGFVVGIILGVATSFIVTKAAFTDLGAIGVFISIKGIVISLLTPAFTALFTLIPIYRVLGRLDAITIIEEG
ncbi:ABC transporter permease [Clostridium intestinale]|uniref:ABC transporter permease n=1 Tax=Clostridium intestinale TaxID=36845 RepID=UPI002DD628DA|nr:ABC transporter permease [Clostridium intestinale]WRY51552.1 ABC transporter permease [Clostridium intestinale]